MSVVAWDGKMLAADRQGTWGGMRREGCKIREVPGAILAGVGDISTFQAMIKWYESGKKDRLWPKELQVVDDLRCQLIVVEFGPKVSVINITPHEVRILEHKMAWGAGADFAVGAMEMGADAKRAVEIACKYSTACGMGVDSIRLSEVLTAEEKKIMGRREKAIKNVIRYEDLPYHSQREDGINCARHICHDFNLEREMHCGKEWDDVRPGAIACINYVPIDDEVPVFMKERKAIVNCAQTDCHYHDTGMPMHCDKEEESGIDPDIVQCNDYAPVDKKE
jgi:hypothetical protein